MSKIKTVTELKSALSRWIGCVQAYHHKGFGGTVYYTDGFKDLLEQAACVWLLTDFLSLEVVQLWSKLDAENSNDLYLFRISVDKEKRCSLRFMDGNMELLKEWEIPYTTFPLGIYDFYISNFNGEPGKMFCFLTSEY